MKQKKLSATPSVEQFLQGKSAPALALYHHFLQVFRQVGPVHLHPAKTMIGIAGAGRRIAWITAIGRDFIHVVFPFPEPHNDNLCFQKMVPVPGDDKQYNHHFRMYAKEDVNEEVQAFMKLAYHSK